MLWTNNYFCMRGILSGAEFEAGFIRLLDTLTNGSRIEVNETGEFWSPPRVWELELSGSQTIPLVVTLTLPK